MEASSHSFPELDIPSIARGAVGSDARVVSSITEMEDIGTSDVRGIVYGLAKDLTVSPGIIASIARHHVLKAIKGAFRQYSPQNPPPNIPGVLMVPGYFGPNHYLRFLARALSLPPIWHPNFEGLMLRGKMSDHAQAYTDLLYEREAPTIVVAHSRGGPTILNALQMMQEKGEDDEVSAMVLISPISYGIRNEIAHIARHLPSRTIREMCPGSEILQAYEELSETNRRKVVVLNSPNGDQFTNKENGHVPRGTTIITNNHDGHIQQVIDPQAETFQIAVKVIEAISAALRESYYGNSGPSHEKLASEPAAPAKLTIVRD